MSDIRGCLGTLLNCMGHIHKLEVQKEEYSNWGAPQYQKRCDPYLVLYIEIRIYKE